MGEGERDAGDEGERFGETGGRDGDGGETRARGV